MPLSCGAAAGHRTRGLHRTAVPERPFYAPEACPATERWQHAKPVRRPADNSNGLLERAARLGAAARVAKAPAAQPYHRYLKSHQQELAAPPPAPFGRLDWLDQLNARP